MMEASEEAELCFPHLLNSSCVKPKGAQFEDLLTYTVLSSISVLTTSLNLLVVTSISHFKYRMGNAKPDTVWWQSIILFFCSVLLNDHIFF